MVMIVSSMMPLSSFKGTDRIDAYGFGDASEEGVSHSKKISDSSAKT